MGVRQKRVMQTVTEYVCDICKRPLPEGSGKVGKLSVKSQGARGRAAELQVHFHDRCYQGIVESASGGAAKRGPRAKTGTRKKKASGTKRAKPKAAAKSAGNSS